MMNKPFLDYVDGAIKDASRVVLKKAVATAVFDAHFDLCTAEFKRRASASNFIALRDAMYALQWCRNTNEQQIDAALHDLGIGLWVEHVAAMAQQEENKLKERGAYGHES